MSIIEITGQMKFIIHSFIHYELNLSFSYADSRHFVRLLSASKGQGHRVGDGDSAIGNEIATKHALFTHQIRPNNKGLDHGEWEDSHMTQ